MQLLSVCAQTEIEKNDTLSPLNGKQNIRELLQEIRKYEEGTSDVDSIYLSLLDSLAKSYRRENDSINILLTNEKLLSASKILYNSNDYEYIKILINVSDDYWNLKLYDNVIRIQEELFDIFKVELGDINDFTEKITLKIATCYSRKREYSKAIEWMLKAIGIQKELYGEENSDYIKSLLLISSYFSNLNEFKQAIDYTEQASYLCKKVNGENDATYEYSISTLSRYYYNIKDYDSAIKLGNKALDICAKIFGENHYNYIICLSNLSMYYETIGNTEKAISLQSLVVQFFKNQNNDINYATSLNNLATRYYKVDPAETCRLLEEAKSVLINEYKSEDIYYTINNNLADCYFKLANYDKSAEAIIEAVEFARKDILLRRATTSNTDKYYNWEKYYLLFNRILPYILSKSENKQYIDEIYNYSALFSKVISQYPTNLADMLLNISNNEQHIGWKDICKVLDENEIAIEYLNYVEVGENKDNSQIRYYALVLEKESLQPQFIPLCYEIDYLNSSPTRKYELIWKPILSHFGSKIKKIYFSPSGILNSKCIEYLPINDSININELYDIYRLSTTAQLLRTPKEYRKFSNIVLFGGLIYNTDSISNIPSSLRSGFDYLPNTLLEVNDIGGILNDHKISYCIYDGLTGTEDIFKKLSGSSTSIIHMATHGFYVRPEDAEKQIKEQNMSFILKERDYSVTEEMLSLSRSALVLSKGNLLPNREVVPAAMDDGILTANEISSVDLQQCDLVVLSACNTGLGDITIDGSYGFQRAFKKAGVNSILMSLTKVDDDATRILMVEFYKNLVSGKNKHQSLKDAQKYLRSVENGKYENPIFWTSFILLDGLN